MPEGKRNRIRLLILIGLSVIFVATGYFRFFHKKGQTEVVPPAASAPPAATAAAPGISAGSIAPMPQPSSPSPLQAAGPLRSTVRDIFAPRMQPLGEGSSPASQPAASRAGFILGGTIVGGGKPLAIINDQYLGVGSTIGGYRVKNITRKGVTLQSDLDRIELTVLSDMESAMPDSPR